MHSSRVARTCLRRVFRRITIQHDHHTTRPYSTQTIAKGAKYTITASALAGIGIWWLLPTTCDNVPQLETREAEHMINKPALSKDEITRMLSQNAYSFTVKRVSGVSRYYGAQLASNSPCEDRFVHGKLPSPRNDDKPWMAWAVFDGHAGWQTADVLEKQLLPLVQQYLSKASLVPKEQPLYQESVQRAITKAFVHLDSSIIETARQTSQSHLPLQEKMQKLMPAFAGSCALLSLYDPVTRNLHVACTGDSRAVLGQRNSDGSWEAVPLSIDQTGSNAEEIARLRQEHPGEQDMIKDGRVLGLAVSRAFGDGRWKWPLELQKEFRRRFYGPKPLTPEVQTPPYVTAEPVVTTTKIDPKRPSFLILATDGMWDTLTNQQAVNLVGTWLESQANGTRNSKPKPMYDSFDFGQFWKGVNWKFEEERTTTQDENVAVHLMRNSLGGNHDELIAGRLAASAPFSRDLRDDITVQVAFFDCPGPVDV
jgi:pyruvate dehydrogenase phosphatase